MGQEVTILTAFVAGVISFLSPCVLPLVPSYIGLLSGASAGQMRENDTATRSTILTNSILFVLGFSVVFISLGASASALGGFLQSNKLLMGKIAGVIIVLFGVFLLGLIKIPALYSDKRFHGAVNPGKVGAFFMGLAFAFGWTPCIGPILGATLMMAANADTLAQGTFLLAIYSAGLAVPFLLTAVGLNQFMSFYKNFRRHMQWVERFAGALLIVVGVMIYFNMFTWFSGQLGFLNDLVLWLEKTFT